ncbi:putative non-ribosomal peptide synthase/polyketide synthase [Burkholderia pseudomallei]|nr:putative non-ribosomal peptide synthase/polyketide synthase [Burkholderia pseudomallei]
MASTLVACPAAVDAPIADSRACAPPNSPLLAPRKTPTERPANPQPGMPASSSAHQAVFSISR